ncbi:hypothetical protein EHQ53_03970 [Leptospira langatensis]|uniref:Uncharacterized protein n=1 Tax=Leptospira langatensis TaxID=2484983 RepID=A0A5F1ZY12_9LEPT|nr:hypothetical protein [Leptospira langatensis]TGJ99984.1 hypothetical protein EHO57_11835 [Leptospira langatensis]TGL42622.1 hypothetical protein EHQ53_03970 [Leptospira langatensis]
MRRLLFIGIILFSFTHCPAPSVHGKFIITDPLNKKQAILPEDVIIFRESLPPGIKESKEYFEVEKSYSQKIELIGKIEVFLETGLTMMPGITVRPYFISEEDEGILGKYCRNNVLIVLPVPLINVINPLGWPCLAMSNYAGRSGEAVAYQDAVREKVIREKAAANGANIVFMLKVTKGLKGIVSQALNQAGSLAGTASIINNIENWEIYGIHVLDKSYYQRK